MTCPGSGCRWLLCTSAGVSICLDDPDGAWLRGALFVNSVSSGAVPRMPRAMAVQVTLAAEIEGRMPPRSEVVVHTVTTPILEARGISRSFGHVRALHNADFDILPGEVVALIGDNGAGKSTMVKALSGNLELDAGELFFEGNPVKITSPQQATQLGMEVVYQDLALAPHLNPFQNMFLGREIPRQRVLGHVGIHGRQGDEGQGQGGL